MKTAKSFITILLLLISCLIIASCDDDEDLTTPRTHYYSAEIALGNGTLKGVVKLANDGKPEMVGVVFTEAALTGLPHEMRNIEIPLPAQAAATPFDHIGFDWNPHGHEPEGIYSLPHFDIHFYMMSSAARRRIELDDPLAEKLPAPRYMPASYIALPGSVPAMGKHWIDPAAPELNGAPFTETFLMGSFNEQVTFYEPMITVDYLKGKTTKVVDLALPVAYQQTGKYYPTQYKIDYDAVKKEYTVSLLGLVQR